MIIMNNDIGSHGNDNNGHHVELYTAPIPKPESVGGLR